MKKLIYILLPFIFSCSQYIKIECDNKWENDYRYVQIPINTAKRISDRFARNDVKTIVCLDKNNRSYLRIKCDDLNKNRRVLIFWKDEILPDRYYDDIKNEIVIKKLIIPE